MGTLSLAKRRRCSYSFARPKKERKGGTHKALPERKKSSFRTNKALSLLRGVPPRGEEKNNLGGVFPRKGGVAQQIFEEERN